MSETWTIGELAQRAAALLGDDSPRANGRVREVPNERLIRWYTTIGLVDPPLTRRGRVALYGRRHLLQLVAVKRRQAAGLTIAAIQAELAGATDGMLQQIAELPDQPGSPNPQYEDSPAEISSAEASSPAEGRYRFWTRHVTTPSEPVDGPPAPAPDIRLAVSAQLTAPDVRLTMASGQATAAFDLVVGLRLARGVTVLLDGAGHMPTSAEAAALRRAAEPFLTLLTELGLHDAVPDHVEGMTP